MKISLRIFAMTLALFLFVAPLTALAQEPLKIVTASFPCYDFARAIAGDQANVTLLLPPGSEAHSYEPTPRDIIAIQSADLLLFNGGESDVWMENILLSMGNEAPLVFRLTDHAELLTEEHTASMQSDEEADGDAELDEHVWTSPKRVKRLVSDLCDTLTALRPEAADIFAANLQTELEGLNELDQELEAIIAGGSRQMIVFGDRFPFRYLAADYGLSYDAAFPGCSEDSEPSVQTIASLIELIRKEQIPVVFYIEFSSRKTADVVAEETGAQPLLLHSCHNVTQEEMDSGATYLTLMRQNCEALRLALE